MSAPLVLVAGTHGLDRVAWLDLGPQDVRRHGEAAPWWLPGSCFADAALDHGLTLLDEKLPFVWSTALDGIRGESIAWAAGGAALYWYVRAHHPDGAPVSVIAHSHGGQVALIAAARFGVNIETLVTAGTPVRADMEATARLARHRIQRWVHLYSDADRWQEIGGLVDGHVGVMRQMEHATVNVLVPGLAHEAFRDHRQWTTRGWWGLLGATPPDPA